jgi:hypothetical protein
MCAPPGYGNPSRIVEGVAKRAVFAERAHLVQRGVAAGDHEPQERRRGRIVLQEHREEMTFDVVHADQRQLRGEREHLRDLDSNQQRANQARTAGDTKSVELRKPAAGRAQRFIDDRQDALQVIARSQLRYDAAVARVQVGLGVDHV